MLATRYAGIQTKLKNINEYGCHFLTLCSIAEEALQWINKNDNIKIDLIDAINTATTTKVHNKAGALVTAMDSEYEVQNNAELLEALTPRHHWKAVQGLKQLPSKIEDNQFTEVVYKNPRTNFKHYRRRSVDTLIDSVTVKEGYILEYRIYTMID